MQTNTKRESVVVMPNTPGKGNASNCQPTPFHAFYGDSNNTQGGYLRGIKTLEPQTK
jgi:hypothetical protein